MEGGGVEVEVAGCRWQVAGLPLPSPSFQLFHAMKIMHLSKAETSTKTIKDKGASKPDK